MTSIDRRSLLTRGAAVVGAAGVTAIPALALAKVSEQSTGDDAELLDQGERCKALALETKRLSKLFQRAAARTEEAFCATGAERWHCDGYLGSGTIVRVPGSADAWQVFAIDGAPNWFAAPLGREHPARLSSKWIRLKAGSEEEAKSEARALDRKLDNDFFEKRKQAGVPFDRDAHYKNWSRSHTLLRRAVAQLARLKATTIEGLNMKAMVLAIAHDVFDDPDIWNEPLQKSITRDLARMAA